ncbi:MAG: alpha/beta hydrolase family protein [Saccharofermentanales bacterium]
MNAFLDTIKLGYLYKFPNKAVKKVATFSSSMACSSIKIRTYETENTYSPLIVLHGMSPQGYDEKRMTNFCKVLASVGFKVYTPDLDGLKNQDLEPEDVTRVIETIRFASDESDAEVGILGFSFGATYGIIAAVSNEVRNKIKFIFSAGAYWSLENVISNAFNDKNASVYKIMQEENKVETLDWWKEKLGGLKILDLKNNDYINELNCEILLLHSMNDKVIPISEAYEIIGELKRCGKKAYCCLSDTHEHVEYSKGKILGVAGIFYRLMKLR